MDKTDIERPSSSFGHSDGGRTHFPASKSKNSKFYLRILQDNVGKSVCGVNLKGTQGAENTRENP